VETRKPTEADIALSMFEAALKAMESGCSLGIEPHFNDTYIRSCCNCKKPIDQVELNDWFSDHYPIDQYERPEESYTENEQLVRQRKMCLDCFYLL
jgi:hypothetical protein